MDNVYYTVIMEKQETWKDIKGYTNLYQISNLGNVKSFINWTNDYNKKERFLTPVKSNKGYLAVFLYKKKIAKHHSIHRLVAKYFIDNPQNKPEVNHKDLNKSNNNVENLEWCTRKENINHAVNNNCYKSQIKVKGEENGQSILKEFQVLEILTALKNYKRGMKTMLAKKYGVSRETICGIVHKRTWRHVSI